MSARIFKTPIELLAAVGESFTPTEWVAIEQDRIDLFADATDDHQWIHVDPERAKDGPFGGTIAHGYLTMSLVNRFLPELIEVRGVSMGVNVGTDNLRFLSPVRAGSRIRGKGELVKAEEAKGGIQAVVRVTVEIEGAEKPACVVDTISRFYPDA
ncbi:dehydratase [Sphingopyxis sp. Root214]|uniref:MaoC family dehydratase n=1 Tax=unclassified Sphingopyxis TaxID=2614943 RepID=UPI0007017640|nr:MULTISPECIES: MaoC family dehydratase [unclassified Sphingopyxis]KQZ76548.1 dehydratase [Sphingopyxis sp. Root154]KRC09565.1 dehydratase [Sphingopyxis sp. Root214]